MGKKVDLLYFTAGAIGVGTLLQMVNEHIDKTEDSKRMRIVKKVGLGMCAFAVGVSMAYNAMAGNLAADMYAGNMKLRMIKEKA